MHNLQINTMFPTPIAKISNVELAKEMLPVCRKILDDPRFVTNMWDYKNTYTSSEGIEVLPQMEKFKQYILEVGTEFISNIGYDPIVLEGRPTQIFTSQMNKQDSHGRHAHPGAILSGVFYLNVPQGSSPLVLYDPRNYRDVLIYPSIKNTEYNTSNLTFCPEVGDLLIWESWLHHEVITNKCDDRVTLVFNL